MAGVVVVSAAACEVPLETASVPAEQVEVQEGALKGENQGGTNLGGINLGGINMSGTNLGGINLGGINMGGPNLGGINMSGTNLGGNNLGGINMSGSNLGGINLGGINLGGINLGGINLSASNLSGSNLGGINVAGNNLTGTNLGGINLGGINTGRNIHNLTGSINGMLYSAEDMWLPRTGQCIVTGIGSTAFSKLLGQQSSNARISVALGKLPWGFASSAGGPVTLSAWEAIVWGDKSYCVFVMSAPPATSWAGVAGFIKAVFRWNAPPSQSMDISGIEASAAHDPTVQTSISTYTGMMGAAARQRAGTIAARDFVAGQLAFATATTNNQSVMVDFSSWVLDSTGKGLVLGNVDGTATRRESVYSVVENADGTVAVLIGEVGQMAPIGGASTGTGTPLNDGIISSNKELGLAWSAFLNAGAGYPAPRRCSGALALNVSSWVSVPAGKCDSGLLFAQGASNHGTWASVAGTTAPFNGQMWLNTSSTAPYKKGTNGYDLRRVLSETYIHMWDKNYDLLTDRTSGGTVTSTGTACSSSQTATQAFDNKFATAYNSVPTKWCVTGAPSTSSPKSLMYAFGGGSSYKITRYVVVSADNSPDRDPKDWTLQGCSGSCTVGSDSGWVTLDTRTGETFPSRFQYDTGREMPRMFSFTNGTAYSKYRLKITRNNGSTSNLQVADVQLYE
jgi:uncharacterized protein YjbI with pentapeptide repeats